MTLGQKIKYYREKQKMGQEHLAELSHIAVSTIRKYEADERNPKEEQLEKLAHALHISPVALKDNTINDLTDALPALYNIGLFGDIQFCGELDVDGNYDPETFSIKFKNKEIMDFLIAWAKKKAEADAVINAASLVKDSETQELMRKRIDDIYSEIENKLVLEKVAEQIYFEDELPNIDIKEIDDYEYKGLDNYGQVLDLLYSLAVRRKFECVGVWEKMWIPKAIFTFESDMGDIPTKDAKVLNLFGEFLYYYQEFKKSGRNCYGYSFMQGGVRYNRYIIEDRTLAEGLEIIKDILSFDFENCEKQEEVLFHDSTRRRIEKYEKIKVEPIGKKKK
jgi:transcriptional regulator with XRE-family HTH domain